MHPTTGSALEVVLHDMRYTNPRLLYYFLYPSYLSDACKSAPEASRRLRSSGASHASYRGPELVWATGRLMSPDRGFGTSCLLHCGHLTVSEDS